MPRVWKQYKDCTTCDGTGLTWVLAKDADPDEAIPDYREAYCAGCGAGKLRYEADGGKGELTDA